MSGQHKLIQSQNAIEGSNIESLQKSLAGDMNEEAARITNAGLSGTGDTKENDE